MTMTTKMMMGIIITISIFFHDDQWDLSGGGESQCKSHSNHIPLSFQSGPCIGRQWRGEGCHYSVRQRYHCNEFPNIGPSTPHSTEQHCAVRSAQCTVLNVHCTAIFGTALYYANSCSSALHCANYTQLQLHCKRGALCTKQHYSVHSTTNSSALCKLVQCLHNISLAKCNTLLFNGTRSLFWSWQWN